MSRTITRDRSLDNLDPIEAATRVDTFIGTPQQSGPWQISEYVVDEKDAKIEAIREAHGDRPGRKVPAGKYLKLHREDGLTGGGDDQSGDDENRPFTIMSNTPDEITDHSAVFADAKGDVLVTGLGLSCVVSGLLAKPEVNHIDVIDLSPDIISMVGPAYKNETRVEIHHGDALRHEWPEDKMWDYAWHDIWALISDANLVSDSAENNVSYFDLFERYRGRVEQQNAWAFLSALRMKRAGVMADDKMREFQRRWRTLDVEGRIDLGCEFTALSFRGDPGPTTEDIRKLYEMNPQQLEAVRLYASQNDSSFFMVNDHVFFEAAREEITEDDAQVYIDGDAMYVDTPPRPFEDPEEQERFEKATAEKKWERKVAIDR